jgi:hypothetical protein
MYQQQGSHSYTLYCSKTTIALLKRKRIPLQIVRVVQCNLLLTLSQSTGQYANNKLLVLWFESCILFNRFLTRFNS